MTDTRLRGLAEVPVSSGLDETLKDPRHPEWFAGFHEGRLARLVGVSQFGVNHVTLDPGARSSLRHWHEGEDEFVCVLVGRLTLIDDNGEHPMEPGSFAGFPAGQANAHQIANRSDRPAVCLVIGSRRPGRDRVHYPDDDLGPVER